MEGVKDWVIALLGITVIALGVWVVLTELTSRRYRKLYESMQRQRDAALEGWQKHLRDHLKTLGELGAMNEEMGASVKRLQEVLGRANIEILPDGSHQFRPKAIRAYCDEITGKRVEELEGRLERIRTGIEALKSPVINELEFPAFALEDSEVWDDAIEAALKVIDEAEEGC